MTKKKYASFKHNNSLKKIGGRCLDFFFLGLKYPTIFKIKPGREGN